MAVVSLVSIVFTIKVKNFAISLYKLRKGIVYTLALVRNVCYKYKNAVKNCGQTLNYEYTYTKIKLKA